MADANFMKQKIQVILIIGMVLAGIRLAWIFYERHENSATAAKQEAPMLDPDFYVHPKKIFPYDLKSAKAELMKQPAWVKVGYAYPYFPYNSATRSSNLAREAGKLLPIQKLEIKDVLTAQSAKHPSERQILGVFAQDGKSFATPVGTETQGNFSFWINDMLFLQDPHQLYNRWPAEVWQAIDQHQVKPGMSELQADFAVGIGLLLSDSSSDRTLNYPNGGKPITITFQNGKAVEIKPGPA